MSASIGAHYPDRSKEESWSLSVFPLKRQHWLDADTNLCLKSRNENKGDASDLTFPLDAHRTFNHHLTTLHYLLYSSKKCSSFSLALKEILWYNKRSHLVLQVRKWNGVARHGRDSSSIRPLGKGMNVKHCAGFCRGDNEQERHTLCLYTPKRGEIRSARTGETVGEASNLVNGSWRRNRRKSGRGFGSRRQPEKGSKVIRR